jgi:hypothetical protein
MRLAQEVIICIFSGGVDGQYYDHPVGLKIIRILDRRQELSQDACDLGKPIIVFGLGKYIRPRAFSKAGSLGEQSSKSIADPIS